MTLSVFHIFLLLVGLFIGMYFYAGVAVREIALAAARAHCNEMNVQLLDQSVGIHRVWLKRGDDNKIHIWRNYQFEFTSTGNERYKGHIITLGKVVESTQLQAHKLPGSPEE